MAETQALPDDGVIDKLHGYDWWQLEHVRKTIGGGPNRPEHRYRCEIGNGTGYSRAAYGATALEAIDNAIAVWERQVR